MKNKENTGSGPPGASNWARIRQDPRFHADALALATGGKAGQPDLEFKLVQRGMLSAVKGIESDPSLTMTLPYLVALAKAHKEGALETGLRAEVKDLLKPKSTIEQVVTNYAGEAAPEYLDLFSLCRSLAS